MIVNDNADVFLLRTDKSFCWTLCPQWVNTCGIQHLSQNTNNWCEIGSWNLEMYNLPDEQITPRRWNKRFLYISASIQRRALNLPFFSMARILRGQRSIKSCDAIFVHTEQFIYPFHSVAMTFDARIQSFLLDIVHTPIHAHTATVRWAVTFIQSRNFKHKCFDRVIVHAVQRIIVTKKRKETVQNVTTVQPWSLQATKVGDRISFCLAFCFTRSEWFYHLCRTSFTLWANNNTICTR